MIKATSILALAALALGLSTASFAGAQKLYGITNDDNPDGNTASVYQVVTPGSIHQIKTLTTGGTGIGGGYFAAPRNALEQTAACVFVADVGSSDIAAFSKATHFAKVGNYSNAALNSDYEGMGLAASNDGNYLYAAYSDTENIAVWEVGSTCALTLGATASAGDFVSPLAITGNGNFLVVSELDNQFLDSYAAPALTPISHVSTSSCGYPGGVDVADNALIVTGEATLAQEYCTASLSNTGVISSVAGNTMSGAGSSIGNVESPEFDKAAYTTGTGYLYLGAAGYGGGGSFADGGFAVNKVTSGVINSASASAYDAYASNGNSAPYDSNAAVTSTTASGLQAIAWQVDANAGSNTVNLYTVAAGGGTITRYAHATNTSAGYILTISAFPNR